MASKRKFSGNVPKFKQRKTSDFLVGNRFQALSDLDDDEDVVSISSVEEARRFVVKVPPIVIDQAHSFTTVINLLGKNGKYKRMSVGTKVIPNSLAQYEEIISQLKSAKITFYTHPVKDQKRFKLILFGLPQISTSQIMEEFKTSFNIEPITITEIKTTRSSRDDAIYSIEFDRSQISKKEITRIRYFCDVVVQWRNPTRRAKGPTQCSKCTMYGHGASNCYRSNACLGCGGSHDYSTCQLNKTSCEGPVVYKCFNCSKKNLKNVNHRADDPRCPSRREYLEIREKIASRRKEPKTITNRRPTFSFSEDDFPSTTKNNVSNTNTFWPSSGINENRRQNHPHSKSNNNNYSDDNDISNEKIMEIYFEALDALQKCKNKFDKMRVLGMMLKYVI